ncbi:hypothetical protein Xbed_03402 [Xenorhabdus beddingii]|uniref:Trimeric autotransporter adhesin YadA-like C-terminal membrane anchor domain-containing protein n=1 Tax=Xenorhabdus beddingii TaxID=40578 RepID=A0A1Y2SHB1_9GAMM|nr:YadA C-terminal domain-containing protein [Xenorhabdus beddingii]OTA16969.1 hypothetical protein Xbed_03402 [Xenorhabdus beddingii]
MKMRYLSVLIITAMTTLESHADTVVDSITDKGHTLEFFQDAQGNIHDKLPVNPKLRNIIDAYSKNNTLFAIGYDLTNSMGNILGKKQGIYFDIQQNLWLFPTSNNTLNNSNNNFIYASNNNLDSSGNNEIQGSNTTLNASNHNKIIKGNSNELTRANKNEINGNQNHLTDAEANSIDGNNTQLTQSHRNQSISGDRNTLSNSSDNKNIKGNSNELTRSNKNKINGNQNHLTDSDENNIDGDGTQLTQSHRNQSISGDKNRLSSSNDNKNIKGNNNQLTRSDKNEINGDQNNLIDSQENDIKGNGNHFTNAQENTIIHDNNTLIDSAKNKLSGSNNTLDHTTDSDINGNDNYVIHGNKLLKDDQNQPLAQVTSNQSILGGSGNAGLGANVAEINASVVLGHNTSAATTNISLKNAVALNAGGAAGDHVIAIGGNAEGDNTLAIGMGSSSTHGGIAFGAGSIATRADELNISHRQITGVKAGTEDNHIVNVKQLNDNLNDTLKQSKTHTEAGMTGLSKDIRTKADTLQAQANQRTNNILLPMKEDAKERFQQITQQSMHYTDTQTTKYQTLFDKMAKDYSRSRFDQMSHYVDKQQKKINAGISAAMATATIPQKGGNKLSVGIGIASYRDQAAGAVGSIFTVSPHVQIKVAMTYDTQSGTGINSGVAIGF